MAEAVVSAVVDQLVSGGADWIKEEISLLKGVKSKLENMENKMTTIQKVLEDAANQSLNKKNKNIKLWLKKLQDISYDMDDVLDEWSTRVHMLRREEPEENNTSSPSPPAGKFTCFSLKKLDCFSSVKQLSWRRDIALRIESINEKIDFVFSDMKDFELVSKAVGNDDAMNKIINDIIDRTTTSFVDETKVFDRDDEKDFLLRKVLSVNTEQEESLQVISIVGSGGLGKTTLAQIVYNHGKVKQKFDGNIIWVCVSDPFDEVKVAKDILEGLKVDHTTMTSLQTLHESIGKSLSGRKFLLVLDDVWNENPDKWEKLRICLKLGDSDCRILVTTRKEEVALMMNTTPSNILKPRLISHLDCWKLMNQIAFQGRANKVNDELEAIGKEIAKKCKGLPLAAKMLGGMLRSEVSVAKWTAILDSEIWLSEQAEVTLFPHIFLSYRELSPMLKRCFFILAIFPKDTRLKVEDVIRIWMAHGSLNPRTKKVDMASTCQNNLKLLVSRALLEENGSEILMHDIIHDFALHLLGDEVISIGILDKIENDNGLSLKSATPRHLYIDGNIDRTSTSFDVKKLHTGIIRNVEKNTTLHLVKKLKVVRALYLVRCRLKEVPQSIKKLIHLRLLDLSGNPLAELPETIGGLYNLQELILKNTDLSTLPDSIGDLIHLRLLDLRVNLLVELPETIGGLYNLQRLFLQRTCISTLPDSIGKLTNLIFLRPEHQELKKFPESVGKLTNLHDVGGILKVGGLYGKLGFLKDLNQLQGKLEIAFRGEYDDEVDVKEAAIEKKKHITEFVFDFDDYKVTDGVIAALQPPSNIQKLEIESLPRSCVLLPGWITSLHHLTKLRVFKAPNVSTLPPLGELQYLKTLHLGRLYALKVIGRECWGQKNDEVFVAFPSLLNLEIHECEFLEEWSDIKAEDESKVTVMPKLQQVKIGDCPKLHALPYRLLCRAASLEELDCYRNNSLLDEYIKNDKQLLERVKNVYINFRPLSLHPLAEYESESE